MSKDLYIKKLKELIAGLKNIPEDNYEYYLWERYIYTLESELTELEKEPTPMDQLREAFEPIQKEEAHVFYKCFKCGDIIRGEYLGKHVDCIEPDIDIAEMSFNEHFKAENNKQSNTEDKASMTDERQETTKSAEDFFYSKYTFNETPKGRLMMYVSEIVALLQEYALNPKKPAITKESEQELTDEEIENGIVVLSKMHALQSVGDWATGYITGAKWARQWYRDRNKLA